MKKIIILLTILLLSAGFSYSASLASNAVSDSGVEIRDTNGTGALIGKLSTGVSATFQLDATGGAAYAVATGHLRGTKAYASASGDTKLYTQDKTADSILTGVLSDTGFSQFSSGGWTEL